MESVRIGFFQIHPPSFHLRLRWLRKFTVVMISISRLVTSTEFHDLLKIIFYSQL